MTDGAPPYQPVLPITIGRFLTPLRVQVLEERDPSGRELYVPIEPFGYWSRFLDAEIWVPAGEVNDGESVPLVLRSPAFRASRAAPSMTTATPRTTGGRRRRGMPSTVRSC